MREWRVWVTGMSWKLPEVMLQIGSPFQEPWLGMLEEGPQCPSFQQEGMLEEGGLEGVALCSGHTKRLTFFEGRSRSSAPSEVL